MKHILYIMCTFAFALAFLPAQASVQETTADNDSAVNALKIANLKGQIADLNKQIKKEDAKRNKTILGVSAEQLDIMNERQDSICLDLRSQLTDKELELKEIVAVQTAASLAQQASTLQQSVNAQQNANNQQNTGTTTTPGKPNKPNKPNKPGKPSKPNKPSKPSKSSKK